MHRKKGGLVVGGLGLLPAGSGSGFLFSGSVVFVVVADAHIACWKGTWGFTLLHMQLQLGKQKTKCKFRSVPDSKWKLTLHFLIC